MSRFRLTAKVRTNADYKAMTRWLDEQGLRHEVIKPNNKGHPALRIHLDTGAVDMTIACTPMGGVNAAARVSRLKRLLLSHGWGA